MVCPHDSLMAGLTTSLTTCTHLLQHRKRREDKTARSIHLSPKAAYGQLGGCCCSVAKSGLIVKDTEAQHAAVHEVEKSRTGTAYYYYY